MSEENERIRVEAEKSRVEAEADRRHAESNEGTGRREAEVERVDAEKLRRAQHEEQMSEYEKFQQAPEHYITPGARSYFRRVWMGYAVLALAGIIGVWGVTERLDEKIRKDINSYSSLACKTTTRGTIILFNKFVDTNIAIQKDALENNLKRGDTERAAININAIKNFEDSKLPVRTDEDCDRPILKP